MRELLSAFALALVLEGVLYAAFPEQMKRMLVSVLAAKESQLRWSALTIAAAGLIVLVLVRG